MGVLGTVSTAKRHNQADDLAAAFESRIGQRGGYFVGNERIRSNRDVPSRNKNAQACFGPIQEKAIKRKQIAIV